MADSEKTPMLRFNGDELSKLAGAESYARGQKYLKEGRVHELEEMDGKVLARVLGSESYRVVIQARDGSFTFSCTCPVGQGSVFCKHCVAAVLAWTARQNG